MLGKFGHRTDSVKSLHITVIPFFHKETKSVVKQTVLVLHLCQPSLLLRVLDMTTGPECDFSFYLTYRYVLSINQAQACGGAPRKQQRRLE